MGFQVEALQRLYKGDKRNYRWGGRQPLRRRRGDVHGDLTAVVLRLDWDGKHITAQQVQACINICMSTVMAWCVSASVKEGNQEPVPISEVLVLQPVSVRPCNSSSEKYVSRAH